jgi:hypothetical protein
MAFAGRWNGSRKNKNEGEKNAAPANDKNAFRYAGGHADRYPPARCNLPPPVVFSTAGKTKTE